MASTIFIPLVESGTTRKYRRSCTYASFVNQGCTEKNEYLNGKEMKVDECICDKDECNRNMGEIETSSTIPETTTKGRNKKICENV